MNPAARLSAALLVGLVLWLPSLSASMRGEIDLPEAAMRYLVAFLLARVAVGFLTRLVSTYAQTGDGDAASVEDVTDPEPKRRRTDGMPTTAGLS